MADLVDDIKYIEAKIIEAEEVDHKRVALIVDLGCAKEILRVLKEFGEG